MVEGLLLVDKPAGWTSHDVVRKVKGLLRARRVGHTGTLDPDATGLLVLCINGATKWTESLMGLDKTYRATVCLGRSTDTGDASGKTTESQSVRTYSLDEIEAALSAWRGEVQQRVPLYSAVKVGGKRLYKLARQERDVVRPLRTVTFYALQLESWSSPQLRLFVHCSKGTYIRSLAEDIGKNLGSPAHLAHLTRLSVGPFQLDRALTLEAIEGLVAEHGLWPAKRLISKNEAFTMKNAYAKQAAPEST